MNLAIVHSCLFILPFTFLISIFSRGFVYSKNLDILPCHVAYGNSLLLSRPISYDQESDVVNLCQVIDPDSLQVREFSFFSLSLSLSCFVLISLATVGLKYVCSDNIVALHNLVL